MDGRLAEADPRAGEGQGQADDEPHAYENEHGCEGDGAAGATSPHEQVEKEEDGEDGARDDDWCERKILLPFFALEELVCSCRNVPANEAEESVEQDHDGCEGSAVGWREEAKEGKYCCSLVSSLFTMSNVQCSVHILTYCESNHHK